MSNRFEPTATIVADSHYKGSRLTTALLQLHRFVLPELTRHRLFSFSVASSRAIPTATLIQQVEEKLVYPLEWGKNQPGMQATEKLPDEVVEELEREYDNYRRDLVYWAQKFAKAGMHKQLVNRVLEPVSASTVLLTGTARAFKNLFSQRCHPSAQPEIRVACERLQAAYIGSIPEKLELGQWHLPFFTEEMETLTKDDQCLVSAARCARTSYNNHLGKRELHSDLRLANDLLVATPPHASPFEHLAVATEHPVLLQLADNSNLRYTNFCSYRSLMGLDVPKYTDQNRPI